MCRVTDGSVSDLGRDLGTKPGRNCLGYVGAARPSSPDLGRNLSIQEFYELSYEKLWSFPWIH